MEPSKISLLVVDDEPAMRRVLRNTLQAIGYTINEAATGEEALASLRRQPCELVLLDIDMPGIGGIDACRHIRELAPAAGIVMISVFDREEEKVRALEAGADDYVTKPFRFRELLARLRAVRRRTQFGTDKSHLLAAGDLELDTENRTLRKNGCEIRLSQKEFDILAFLMRHPDTPVPHARLLQAVWGPEYGGETEYLRTYMRHLRKKIEVDPARPEYILTEPWVGYRFHDPGTIATAVA